jgi:hypothetical protein
VRISGGEQHAAGLTPLAIGDVNGRANAIPVMTLSRGQLLLDLGVAMQQKLLTLPVDDKAEATYIQMLKTRCYTLHSGPHREWQAGPRRQPRARRSADCGRAALGRNQTARAAQTTHPRHDASQK